MSKKKRLNQSRKRAQTNKRKRRIVEALEARDLLAGDLNNALIDDTSMTRLTDGLDDVAAWAASIDQLDSFSDPFAVVTGTEGESLSIESIFDFEASIESLLSQPTRDHLSSLTPASRESESLATYLDGLPNVTVVNGGFSDDAAELRFDLEVSDSVTVAEFSIDLGSEAEAIGLDVTSSVEADLIVDVQYNISFGVLQDASLTAEQAFFLRDTSVSVDTSLLATAEQADLQIGFLDASGTFEKVNLDFDVELTLNDVIADAQQNITLSEINGFSILDLASVQVTSDSVTANLTTNPSIGNWTALGTPTVTITASSVGGVDASVTTNADYAELLAFDNIEAQGLYDALGDLTTWLQDFGGSTEFYLDLPFVETDVASAFDPSTALQSWIDSLQDADGELTFAAISQFEAIVGLSFSYDPVTDLLTMPVSLDVAKQGANGQLSLEGQFGLVGDIEVDSDVSVAAEGSVEFDLVIDLSSGNTDYSDIIGVSGMTINAALDYSASNIDGAMSYGIVGLDFEDASITGSLSLTADIQNPYDASARATVSELFGGLFVPSSLLAVDLKPEANANVDFGAISVHAGLFSANGLTLNLNQAGYDVLPTLVAAGNDFLDAIASIDIHFFADQLKEAADQSQSICDLSECWNELVGMIPVVGDGDLLEFDLDDLLDLDQGLLLHEIPAAIEALPGLLGLSPNLQISVDESNSTVTFAMEFAQQVVDVEHEFGLSFGTGLGDAIGDDLFGDIGEFGGTGGSVDMDVDVALALDVQIDFSGSDVEGYVLDSTGVTAEFLVDDQVSFSGSLSALGAEFEGSLVVAEDATSRNPSTPASVSFGLVDRVDGRYPLDGSLALDVDSEASGQLVVSYDLTVTPDILATDPLAFEVLDLNDALGSLNVMSAPNFVELLDGLDIEDNLAALPDAILSILDKIADAADDGLFGIKLPVIGDLLEGDGNFLRNLYETLSTEFSGITDYAADLLEEALEGIIADALGLSDEADRVVLDLSDLNDILLTLDLSGTAFEIEKTYETDLGFPALGASLNAQFGIDGTYDAVLTFGLDDKGVYLLTEDIQRDGETIRGDDVGINLGVDIVGNPKQPDFEGRLGFIQVEVDNVGNDTVFHAVYDIDITEPGNDGKLHLDELGSLNDLIDLDASGLSGGTGPDKNGVLELGIGVGVAEWAPSLYADLEIEWHFDGFNFQGDNPRVEYTDVGVELGNLIDNTICPFAGKVREYTSPLDPVVDVFETRIGIISDVLNDDITILDLANVGEEVAGLVDADRLEKNLKTVTTFVDVLSTVRSIDDACSRTGDASVSFGSLSLQGISASASEVAIDWLEDNAGLDLGSDPIQTLKNIAQDFYEETQAATVTGLEVAFPLLENPLSGFEWLLGIRHVPIVTLDVVDVSVNLELPLTFPIGPAYVGLEGGLEIDAGLAVGFDTLGFTDFFQSKNAADLFNGFYISDGEFPDGGGKDVPEISIVGSLAAVAGIGFEDFGAGVYGGLFADIEVDLIDPDEDGRVRGFEFSSEEGCIQIDGGVDLEAGIEANALGFLEADIPLGSEEIASFGYTVYCAPVTDSPLADLNTSTNTLTLLVGEDAKFRTVSPNVEEEYFEVEQTDLGLLVSAFGKSQLIKGRVDKIVANAGTEDDTIIIASGIKVPAHLDGGAGENTLIGGSGNDTLTGGSEADHLEGGDGDDTINTGDGLNIVDGGEGMDTINGGNDRDEIDGGGGVDTINGDGGDDLIYGGGEGDTLNGGTGEDYIDGEGGDDTINGDEGDDDLFGGSGVDTIKGNQNADYIDGGGGGDFLYGNNGPDTIEGGEGDDTIEGGNQNDIINGGDGDDTIDGGDGVDTIHGDGDDNDGNVGSDDDTINGDEGDDLLFGDRGDDMISGGLGDDTIEGNAGNDELSGNDGIDTVNGNSGNDTLEGGGGGDNLYGDSGDDTIYGYADVEVGLPLLNDDDTIYGDTGDDVIYGQTGFDTIYGEDGEDTLDGGPDNDTIYGGEDADTIRGDSGEDLLLGEWGGDTIEGGEGNDEIRGMTGNDRLFGDDGEDEIFGDDGDDYVEGGAGNDHIEGGQGDDELHGNEANDRMFGQNGDDKMYGGSGADEMYGQADRDFMYGDNGEDRMFGGTENDTMRGGNGVDVMQGNEGDDLMLGNGGNDQIDGDEGNDVLRGNDGSDTLIGDVGNDRAMGGDGNDVIRGDEGNDILEGDAGDDEIIGGAGKDELHGDAGVDSLEGGGNDDYLWAGDGIGNTLLGGGGNDHLVGSEEGQDDPDFRDAIPFGDTLIGGPGNDFINGLGGGDRIEGGTGNDEIHGGPHGDLIIAGPNASAGPDQDIVYGGLGDDIIRGGADADELNGGLGTDNIPADPADTSSANGIAPEPLASLSSNSSPGSTGTSSWASLDGSASTDGLSQVGGFEQASYAADGGVYVAWVDVRDGDSEIYVAFRADDSVSGWEGMRVSDGGLSEDTNASRRPAVVRTEEGLMVSWTNIDENGNHSISVAALRMDALGAGWSVTTVSGGSQSDHSALVPYPGGAMVAWLTENPATGDKSIAMSRYVDCDGNYLPAGLVFNGAALPDQPTAFELDSAEGALAAAILVGDESQSVIVQVATRTSTIAYNCPLPGGGFAAVELEVLGGPWLPVGTFSNENMDSPTIAVGNVAKRERDQGQFEKDAQYAFDIYVAWDYETDRENQVEGRHGRVEFETITPKWNELTPDFKLRSTPNADTLSETLGYAALPSLDASIGEVSLAWMDDSVHQSGGNGNSSIYVLSSGIGANVLLESEAGEASGRGISPNGGALQDLSITVERTEFEKNPYLPYVSWTDAFAGQPQVYVRHDLNSPTPAVLISESDGNTRVGENTNTDSYEITLATQPSDQVVVSIAAGAGLRATPTMVTFSEFNWAVPQVVTVEARDNNVVDGNRVVRIQHQVTSVDTTYDGITAPDVRVGIQDNDFNRDGKLDSKDIDDLFERLSKESTDSRFDINHDTRFDQADVDFLVGDIFGTNSGDANLDGTVDFFDFLAVASNFGKRGGGWSGGDFDGNGGTDFRDFLAVATNFGKRRGE